MMIEYLPGTLQILASDHECLGVRLRGLKFTWYQIGVIFGLVLLERRQDGESPKVARQQVLCQRGQA